jgi:hypothetical protein
MDCFPLQVRKDGGGYSYRDYKRLRGTKAKPSGEADGNRLAQCITVLKRGDAVLRVCCIPYFDIRNTVLLRGTSALAKLISA